MKKPKKILHTFSAGGSAYGMSGYENGDGCGKSAALYKEAKANGRTFMDEKSPLTIGSIGHAFMEMHFGRALNGEVDPALAVRFSDVVDEEARFEAERVFRAWRAKYPSPLEFGKVLSIEEDVICNDKACEIVGVSPFSIKPDLVCELTASDCKRIMSTHDVAGGKLSPGRWQIDHKFDGRKSAYLVDSALLDHRFHAYTLAWNAMRPKQKVKGVLRNTWFKYKEPKGLLVVVPAPTEAQIISLHTFFARMVEIMDLIGDRAVPTKSNCYPYGGVCRWLKEGLCSRY